MATLQSGKCFTVPTFFGMCCRSEWQERMYIYKWHEVDQTKHAIFCVHIVCNEIQVKVNLEITTFFFYLRFPYCPNFFWFGVVYKIMKIWLNMTHVFIKFTHTPYFGSLFWCLSQRRKREIVIWDLATLPQSVTCGERFGSVAVDTGRVETAECPLTAKRRDRENN